MAFPSVSAPLFVPIFPLDRSNSGLKFWRWMGGPIPQLGAVPNLWIWSLQVLSPLCWVFQLMSSLLGSGNLLYLWHLGLSSVYPHSSLLHTSVQFPNLLYFCPVYSHTLSCPLFVLFPFQVPPSLYFPWLFFPLLSRTEASTLGSLFFLHFIWSVSCVLGILIFLANIHLSVSTYHMCSFVTGLSHSGWYFLVLSICLRISWSF